jgi:hypothetical protein
LTNRWIEGLPEQLPPVRVLCMMLAAVPCYNSMQQNPSDRRKVVVRTHKVVEVKSHIIELAILANK